MRKTRASRRLLKKVQMQGGEEARSGTYLDVRCNDERPHSPFERGLRPRKLWGRFRKGGVPPSEESLRRRWAFFRSLLARESGRSQEFPRPGVEAVGLYLKAPVEATPEVLQGDDRRHLHH